MSKFKWGRTTREWWNWADRRRKRQENRMTRVNRRRECAWEKERKEKTRDEERMKGSKRLEKPIPTLRFALLRIVSILNQPGCLALVSFVSNADTFLKVLRIFSDIPFCTYVLASYEISHKVLWCALKGLSSPCDWYVSVGFLFYTSLYPLPNWFLSLLHFVLLPELSKKEKNEMNILILTHNYSEEKKW